MACPVCKGETRALPGGLAECPACGLTLRTEKYFGPPVYEKRLEKDIYGGGKYALFAECIDALARRFPSGGRLLDVGSAYGAFTGLARPHGWEAEGVEVDAEMARAAAASGFKVYDKPLEALGLPSVSYDAVTVFEVLCLMVDPVRAVAEMNRILKPGGLVYIREFNGAFHMALAGRKIFEILGLRPAVIHNFNFTAESLRRMLVAAGFRNIRISNSRPTAGDPYRSGGRLGAALTGAAKALYYYAAQSLYYASLGRFLIGPSFIVEAEK